MNKRTIRLNFFLFLTVLILENHAYCQTTKQLRMEEGKSQTISFEFDIQKVATGDPNLSMVTKTGDKEVLINAISSGQTNLIIWGFNGEQVVYHLEIISPNLHAIAEDLRQILKNIEGVKINVTGRTIVAEGEVFKQKDFEKVNKILEKMPYVVNMVELSPLLTNILKKEIEGALRAEGIKNVTVQTGRGKCVLVGKAATEPEAERALRIAKAFSPDIENAILIDIETFDKAVRMIEMTMNVIEVQRNALKDFGIHWNPGSTFSGGGYYEGQTGQKPTLGGSLTGTLTNLFPKMKRIQDQGLGRSLVNQTAIAKSGGKADFFAGTEIPIPVAQQGGTMSVEYKKIGVTMSFSPFIDANNNIVTSVLIESSRLTGEVIGDAPIISTNRLDTTLSVQDGASIALGGMIGQREMTSAYSAPPGGQPSFFQANKGDKKSSESSEIVIFITPRVVTSNQAAEGVLDEVSDSFKKEELDLLRKQRKQ